MQKRIAAAVCAGLLLLLCACGNARSPARTIDGVPVSQGVYTWFYRDALRAFAQNDAAADEDAAAAQAEDRCRQLVALDNYCRQHRIAVRAELKSAAAQRTEGEWALFRAYYLANGITKPDLTRIYTFEAQKKQLVQTFYGAGGKREVAESALRKSFVTLYVGFRAFEGALTARGADGETVPLDDAAQKELLERFRRMADLANNGTDLDTLYAEFCETQGLIVTTPLAVSLMKSGDPMYDDAFFEEVQKLSEGSTGVIRSANSVYLLQRVAIAESDEDAFAAYRDEVLYHEKLPAIETFVANLGKKTGR